MCARYDVYAAALEWSTAFSLTGPYSGIECHPGWHAIDWDAAFVDLLSRFPAADLIDAGIAAQVDGGLIPDPRLSSALPTFVVRRPGDGAPYALLPGGQSLDGMPGWHRFLFDASARSLIADGLPLLLARPADLPVLMSLGMLAVPVPPIEQMDVHFLDGLSEALTAHSSSTVPRWPRVVVVGWSVSDGSAEPPAGYGEHVEHVAKLKRYFEPEINFCVWPPPRELLGVLEFFRDFGTSQQMKAEFAQNLKDGCRYVHEVTKDPRGRSKPPAEDAIGEYLKSAISGSGTQVQRKLKLKCMESLRRMTTAAADAQAACDPADDLARRTSIEALFVAIMDSIESLARSLDGRERGPGDLRRPSVAQSLAGFERIMKLFRQSTAATLDITKLLRGLG